MFLLIAGALSLGIPLAAQQAMGAIAGTVTDASGAVVVGAAITVTNNSTAFQRQGNSTGTGSYAFQNLSIGLYTVTVTKDGFNTENYPAILVQANRTASLNVQLKLGKLRRRLRSPEPRC